LPTLTTTFRSLLGYTIPEKALAMFFDTLAVQINAGRPIAESLIGAAYNSNDRELIQMTADIAPKLRAGSSLYDCLGPYQHRFPEIVYWVMLVGETSGGLGEASERLAENFKLILGIERDMKTNAYSHPKVLFALCLGYFVVLVVTTDHNSPIFTQFVGMGLQVLLFGFFLVAAFFGLRLISRLLYRWSALRLIVDTIKLALPGLGIISRNLSVARWARSFAVLWRAGINISSALEISAGSALNSHYERELKLAAIQTRQGRTLSDCLERTKLMPPFLLKVIRVSEISGKMDDQLLRIAADMERDALTRSIREMNKIVTAVYMFFILLAIVYVLSNLSSL